MSAIRPFGPSVNIPCELVKSAGFGCRICHRPVERFAQVVPPVIPRMIFHACRCGCVVTWEDEAQVTRQAWRWLVRLLQRRGVDIVMFNGGKESPEFQGVN
jgi:hypothetical protein